VDSDNRVLWVDDQIDGLMPYAQALRQEGIDLDTASSCDIAIKKFKSDSHGSVIVDLRMPEKDGLEFIRHVIRVRRNTNICVYSSYLYLDEYIRRLRGLSLPITLIDKDFPNVNADDFRERFILPLVEFVHNGSKKSIAQQLEEQAAVPDDPFEIDYNAFLRMGVLEKKLATDRAYKLAKNLLTREFQRGTLWIFLCGDPTTIRASARSLEHIQSQETMLSFARAQNRAPFQFFRPVAVDDMEFWPKCGDLAGLNDYPAANIELKNQTLLVHFDTGAPWTFFSYEELVERQVIRPTDLLFAPCYRGAKKYDAAFLDIEVTLRCQIHDDTRTIRLRGQVVRDWLNSPFARDCTEQNCIQLGPTIRNGKNCLLRIGLIGRNVLVENALQIVLDGKRRRTGFFGDGDQ
jgi:CheY-like chemotaxis protein